MDFDLTPDDLAFREEFRAWLAEHAPPDIDVAADFGQAEVLRAWQRTLASERWVGIHWPREYGGRGASLVQVAIYNEELARAHAPQVLGRAGVNLVGPTLIAHGTEAQRARWLQKILDASEIWCQLFSEPGAGSDLAGLSTKAERRGDTYFVTGQKVWTSYALFANFGIALVRTDPEAPKRRGISMLAIPMDAPGIEVRPLRQITGESEFNEVFFSDTPVPAENLIGVEHDGWRVAGTTLANERGTSFVWKEQVLHEVARELLVRRARDRRVRRPDRATEDRALVDRRRVVPLAQRAHAHPAAEGRRDRTGVVDREALLERDEPTPVRNRGVGARLGRTHRAGRRARGGRRPVGAGFAVVARGVDRRRHERDPAQNHRRADPRSPA